MNTPSGWVGPVTELIVAAFHRRAKERGIEVTTDLHNAAYESVVEVLGGIEDVTEGPAPEMAPGFPKPRRLRP